MKYHSILTFSDVAVVIKAVFNSFSELSLLKQSNYGKMIDDAYLINLKNFIDDMGDISGISVDFTFDFQVCNKEALFRDFSHLLLSCSKDAYMSNGCSSGIVILEDDDDVTYEEINEIPGYGLGAGAFYAIVLTVFNGMIPGCSGFSSKTNERVFNLVSSLKSVLEKYTVTLHPRYPKSIPSNIEFTLGCIRHSLSFGNELFGERIAAREILSELSCDGMDSGGNFNRHFTGVSVFIDIVNQYLFNKNEPTITVSNGSNTDIELPLCEIIKKSSRLTEKHIANDAAMILLKVANELSDHFSERPDNLILNYDDSITSYDFKEEFRIKFRNIANKLNSAFSGNTTIVNRLNFHRGNEIHNDMSMNMTLKP